MKNLIIVLFILLSYIPTATGASRLIDSEILEITSRKDNEGNTFLVAIIGVPVLITGENVKYGKNFKAGNRLWGVCDDDTTYTFGCTLESFAYGEDRHVTWYENDNMIEEAQNIMRDEMANELLPD